MVWRVLEKVGIKLLYDPAIPVLVVHPEETKTEEETCIPNVHCSTSYNNVNIEAT